LKALKNHSVAKNQIKKLSSRLETIPQSKHLPTTTLPIQLAHTKPLGKDR